MDDPFDQKKPFTLPNYHVKRLVLSPDHWRTFAGKGKLRWKFERFTPASAAQIPNNKQGIYSFVVKPDIADHPACAYLMYVGKTEKQSLRERFKQYFGNKRHPTVRVHVAKMIQLWEGQLWFYFTPVKNIAAIDQLEDDLITAFLPPFNHKYRGIVAVQIKHLFA